MSEQAQTQTFVLQRIYVKDMSFESPKAPDAFLQQWKPQINLEINTNNKRIGDDNFEVTLSVTVTAKNQEEEVLYLVEVQQAGIFTISGMDDEALGQTLASFCPNVLFPYAREAVDNIVVKGSFPALMLAPVNFDAIYAQARARAEAENTTVQ